MIVNLNIVNDRRGMCEIAHNSKYSLGTKTTEIEILHARLKELGIETPIPSVKYF